MNLYRVTGEWLVKAGTAEEAQNVIEDAVARRVENADLEDCNAELEDADIDPISAAEFFDRR